MKIGSLFTGIGGLELGVFNTVTSIVPYDNNIEWIAETDGNALKILEHSTMFHGVPNLGDVEKIDWSTVPDVDCVTGGSPCQDFSHPGTRKGLEGEKSSLLYTSILLRPQTLERRRSEGFLRGSHRAVGADTRSRGPSAGEAFYHGLLQSTRERTNR